MGLEAPILYSECADLLCCFLGSSSIAYQCSWVSRWIGMPQTIKCCTYLLLSIPLILAADIYWVAFCTAIFLIFVFRCLFCKSLCLSTTILCPWPFLIYTFTTALPIVVTQHWASFWKTHIISIFIAVFLSFRSIFWNINGLVPPFSEYGGLSPDILPNTLRPIRKCFSFLFLFRWPICWFSQYIYHSSRW